jgi:hypothetical protein
MDAKFCPGSRLLRQPHPEIFTCPGCGGEVEIWTDELKADCPVCKKTVFRDPKMNCLEWCKYGRECVGEEIYNRFMEDRKRE